MIADSVLNFGALLKRYRMAAGLTHAELAERAGLSVRAISDLERGVNRKPRKDTVRMLVTALDLLPNDRAALEAAAHRSAAAAAAAPAQPRAAPAALTTSRAMLPLVGRAPELATLMRHCAGEGGPLLLLAGEPGIGKSRLLYEAAQQAIGRGWSVLSGGCHRRSGDEPYAPLIGALERHLEGQPPAQRRQALRGCAWLARMLPELTAEALPLPAWEVPPAQERRLIFKAAATYCANVAGPRGSVLFLDDLQWAGQDALDLLAWLVRSPAPSPLRIVGAYRDTEVTASGPLGLLMADLAREGLVDQLALQPLADAEATQLIADLVSEPPLREQVIRRAEGVPFVLVSCALALRAGSPAFSAEVDLPWSVAATIRQRVAVLTEPAPDLLAAAAIVGRRVPRHLLLTLADPLGWRQPALLAAIDAVCRARLLVEENEETYVFAHDLIREVVATDLSAARRAALHLHVAEALEVGPGEPPIEALADHYARAGVAGKAVDYLERAGDRALSMHANAEAEAYYRDIARRLDALHRPAEAARAREKLARVLRVTGRFDGALDLVEAALADYRLAGDTEGMASAGEAIGWLHYLQGTMGEGLPIVTSLLDDLTRRGVSAGGMAHLYIGLIQLYFSAERFRELEEAALRAFELAREAGDGRLAALAQSKQALALYHLGQLDEGARVLDDARQRMEASGDDWSLITVLNNLAGIYDDEGDFPRALDHLQRALALSERIGDTENIAFMTYRCGQDAFLLGDWTRARADYERAVALIREVGNCRGASYPPAKLARLAFAEGRTIEARQCSDIALDIATRKRDTQSLRYIHTTLAEYELVDGRPEAARTRLVPLLGPPDGEILDVVELLPLLAWAHLELGDLAQSAAVLEQCVRRVNQTRLRVIQMDAWRVAALIATEREHWQDASAAVETALSLARAMRYPYAEAKILYTSGLAHVRAGEPEAARDQLLAAQAILHGLGERPYAAQVERALATLA